MRQPLPLTILLTAMGASLAGQTLAIAPGQNHLFLLADEPVTLQVALDEAGSNGLQVAFSSDEGIFLTRPVTNDATGQYRPIAEDRPQDLEKAFNAGGEEGFRVIPATLTRSGDNTVAIMRRAQPGSSPYRYRILASDGAFDKSFTELTSKGFSLVGVFTQQSGMAASLGRPGRLHVVLESSGDGTPRSVPVATGGQIRVVSTTRTPTMEKRINEAAADGYRVRGGSFMNVLVEKGEPSVKYIYRVIGAIRGTTLTDEIQKAGREGFRVVPSAVMHNPGSKLETAVVMERSATSPRSYEYVFLGAASEGVHGALDSELGKGFVPIGLIMHGSYVIVLEKEA